MFNLNDIVVNKKGQVCKITDITKMDVGVGVKDYFVLEPCYDKNNSLKFYIPIENSNYLRKALSREEIEDIISRLSEIKPIWFQNPKLRRVQFKELYDSGDPINILILIKSFEVKRKEFLNDKKSLSFTDENFLKEIKRNLFIEFSLGLNLPYNDVETILAENLNI